MIPLIVEQALAVTIGVADTVMVAYVGETVVSGVSIVDAINMLLVQVFAALATGSNDWDAKEPYSFPLTVAIIRTGLMSLQAIFSPFLASTSAIYSLVPWPQPVVH